MTKINIKIICSLLKISTCSVAPVMDRIHETILRCGVLYEIEENFHVCSESMFNGSNAISITVTSGSLLFMYAMDFCRNSAVNCEDQSWERFIRRPNYEVTGKSVEPQAGTSRWSWGCDEID